VYDAHAHADVCMECRNDEYPRSCIRRHGHVVSVADVRTKSHRMRLMIGLFRLDVDLLTKGHELHQTIGRQHDVLK